MANWADISFSATQIDYIPRLEQTRIRSQNVAAEVENARDGQIDLLSRIQECMVMSVGFTQDISANGFRLRNLPVPVNADEPATKAYADGLSFASSLPAQANNAGKEITTDGTTASWGLTIPGAIAILNFINYK